MKFKLLPQLLAGAMAATLVTAPSVVQAQLGQSRSGETQNQAKFAGVELTETQRNQLMEIRRNTVSQIETVLTSEQKRQLRASREGGKKQQNVFADINLSQTQKSQIQSIMRSSKNRADAIFTPKQKQQIQRNVKQMKQQRQN
ncbi:MAG: hypothetical protein KME01_05840 [Chroococcus sp. CMT-3BRIN-NPC107]|jgi:Spy/CpxP family protein refolding chaperone|nr:hypothetical protein [Chroococcus sp. CMT-3BRIN-NPC107]